MPRKSASRILIEPHQPWALDPAAAAALLGSPQLLLDMRLAGWIAPLVDRRRLVGYDIDDLRAARAKLRQLGDLKLQEQAALGGKKKK